MKHKCEVEAGEITNKEEFAGLAKLVFEEFYADSRASSTQGNRFHVVVLSQRVQ
jgi:hypothetical protein